MWKPSLSTAVLTAFLLSALFFFAIFHLLWPLVFPTPWSDESHFLIPAVNFAVTGSPTADQMFNSDGIFWVPSGMYLIDGVVFAAAGTDGLRFARAISFAEILAAAFLIRQISVGRLIGFTDATSKATLIALAWFVSMPVMLAANIARPEALVLMLSTAAVLCLVNGFAIGGAGLALLAFLTHPLLAIPAVGVAGYGLVFGSERKSSRAWEWAITALAIAVLAYEASRLILHHQTYLEHWSFQLERKAGRQLRPEALASIFLLVSVTLYFAAMKFWRRDRTGRRDDAAAILLLFGLACLAVHFYGQEMWYWPFAITGCAFVGLGALPTMRTAFPFAPLVRHTGVFAVAAAVALATWALALRDRGFMNFTARPLSMQALSSDRAAVVADVSSYLEATGAKRTLVSPYFFEELRVLGRHRDRAAFFTWNPLSVVDRPAFDSYVRADKNFPLHLSEEGTIPKILEGQRCKSVVNFPAPGGNFVLSVVLLDAAGESGRSLEQCR